MEEPVAIAEAIVAGHEERLGERQQARPQDEGPLGPTGTGLIKQDSAAAAAAAADSDDSRSVVSSAAARAAIGAASSMGSSASVDSAASTGWAEALASASLSAEFSSDHPLAGQRVLMTVGPTREAIDPVRFIGNRSSGKMGYALAEALRACGALVTLVAGPTSATPPVGITRVDVESALEMESAVMTRVAQCDLFIATAAVADYRPASAVDSKLKKSAEEMTLQLVRNPDILARVAALPRPPFTVGFAAETDNLEGYARDKLKAKRLSMMAANRVGNDPGGFESDENALLCLWSEGGRRELPLMSKPALATALADLIAERYVAQSAG